jgi:putative peptidoglycan lipid II flippase
VREATAAQTSPALVIAYGSSYVVGSLISYLLLRGRLGGLQTPVLLRFIVRVLIAAGVSTLTAWAIGRIIPGHTDDVSHAVAAIRVVLLGGIDVALFLVLARVMRITEVTTVLDTLIRRIPGARSS